MNRTEQRTSIGIVGVGALTAVGLTAPSSAAAVRAGIGGFREHPFMIDRQGEPMIVAAVPDAGDSSDDRFGWLAVRAMCEALAPVESYRRELGDIPVFLGLPPRRPGRPENLESRVVESLRTIPGTGAVECIATGHSSGLMALEAAWRGVMADPSRFYLTGGVDSYLEPETLEWLEANDQLHGGPNPYGFLPGEAAGFCLVCSQQAADRFRLRMPVRIRTVQTARETNLIKTDAVCLGEGLTDALRKAIGGLPSPSDRIERIVCDMNGEPYRADEYGFSVARLGRHFEDASDFLAPADCWGDIGAASGPLFVSQATAAVVRGYATSRHHLLWTSSESGERAAVILEHEASVPG